VIEPVGLLEPESVVDYVADFLELVFSRDNRLVWAATINLALIADRQPQAIFERYDDLVSVIERNWRELNLATTGQRWRAPAAWRS
jgi:hypothetical protein